MNDNLNVKAKLEENERKNQFLKLKHDLENALDKIKELEIEKEDLENDKKMNRKNIAI